MNLLRIIFVTYLQWQIQAQIKETLIDRLLHTQLFLFLFLFFLRVPVSSKRPTPSIPLWGIHQEFPARFIARHSQRFDAK